jgi:Fe2+ transport system protein FeoA
MTLNELKVGKKSKIIAVNVEGPLMSRLLDMGFTPNTEVMVRKSAPMGDPIVLSIRGYELAIRKDSAENIVVGEI